MFWCECTEFVHWYTSEDDIWAYCHCGHPDTEHIDRRGTCIGEVEIRAAYDVAPR